MQQNKRGFAAFPIDTATPEDKQCRKLETRLKFCSFPHRHGDAKGKPETRDETRGRSKTSVSCETFPILTHSTRYQTGWNVTKYHACDAKQHDKLRGNVRKGEDTELTRPRRGDHDATATRRATGGKQGSSPQTPRL